MENNQQGGAQSNQSGATDGNQQGNANQENNDGGAGDASTVAKADHERALADLHKFKAEAKKNAEALQKLQNDLKNLKEQGLKSTSDYKTYAEALEQERDQLKTEKENLKSSIANTFKQIEVREAAKKLGLQERALPDLDLLKLDEVEVEFTTGGRVIVNGAAQAAEMLKKTRPHWFTSGQAANINTGGKTPMTPETLSPAYMNGLEKTDPKKYKELFPKFAKQMAARRQ